MIFSKRLCHDKMERAVDKEKMEEVKFEVVSVNVKGKYHLNQKI